MITFLLLLLAWHNFSYDTGEDARIIIEFNDRLTQIMTLQ